MLQGGLICEVGAVYSDRIAIESSIATGRLRARGFAEEKRKVDGNGNEQEEIKGNGRSDIVLMSNRTDASLREKWTAPLLSPGAGKIFEKCGLGNKKWYHFDIDRKKKK